MVLRLEPLRAVSRALAEAGIEYGLGGSGLLCSLGLVQEVRDWDITTDAPLEQVRQCLRAFALTYPPAGEEAPAGGPATGEAAGAVIFATGYLVALSLEGPPIDLIGRFAIRTPAGVCHLPTIPAGLWEGVATGSPEVWAVAYRLMERHPRADLLSRYIQARGAGRLAVKRLLQEPLPAAVKAEVERWPVRT